MDRPLRGRYDRNPNSSSQKHRAGTAKRSHRQRRNHDLAPGLPTKHLQLLQGRKNPTTGTSHVRSLNSLVLIILSSFKCLKHKVFSSSSILCCLQWDVLSNGNAVQEVAHIANGSHPGNCISVLRVKRSFNLFHLGEVLAIFHSSSDEPVPTQIILFVHVINCLPEHLHIHDTNLLYSGRLLTPARTTC